MNKCTWIVQSSLDMNTHDKICQICEDSQQPYLSLPLIPFANEFPEEINLVKYPAIIYGSTTCVQLASQHAYLKRTTYFNDKLLAPSVYCEKLGDRMLNEPLYIGAISNLPNFDDLVFLKCNSDSKQIAGRVWEPSEIVELKDVTEKQYANGNIVSPDTVVFVSTPKNTEYESRLVFLNGEYLTGSYYKHNNRPYMKFLDNVEIISFAKDCIADYNPFPCTVIDIATTQCGMKVVEYNCFNASGFYQCEIDKIISSVSHYLENET